MPVLSDWSLPLDVDAVLAGQGCDPGVVRSRNGAIVDAARRALDLGKDLIDAAVAFRLFEVEAVGREGVLLAGPRTLSGALVANVLGGAERVVAAVATIGSALERRAAALIAEEPLVALAMDGLGTAALGLLSRAVCRHVGEMAAGTGVRATVPLSPGLDGWPLAEGQRELFRLVDGEEIGVRLMSSCQMIPRKSLSLVIGMGVGVTRGDSPCEWCGMRDACRYKSVAWGDAAVRSEVQAGGGQIHATDIHASGR